MFRVTPVIESKERKVSFSPDIDESYRHQVVDKIQNLMKEVDVIHGKEEKHLKKYQETESFDFKRKQELELQAFLKRQKEEQSGFHTQQTNVWNDLKERHTQETWKLFGQTSTQSDNNRGTISNLWSQDETKKEESSCSSPWSMSGSKPASDSGWSSMNQSAASPTWPQESSWSQSNGASTNGSLEPFSWNKNS